MAWLTIRVDFASGDSIGPGKVGLLEAIDETGSIRSAAGRVGMSFRQAWLLLQAIEEMFGAPVVDTSRGGKGGGGAVLTELGHAAVSRYRAIERAAGAAARNGLADLDAKIVPKPRGSARGNNALKSRFVRKPLKKK